MFQLIDTQKRQTRVSKSLQECNRKYHTTLYGLLTLRTNGFKQNK
jgi:hypothetical protein